MDIVSNWACVYLLLQFVIIVICFVLIVFSDEELNDLLDRSDLTDDLNINDIVESTDKNYLKVLNT